VGECGEGRDGGGVDARVACLVKLSSIVSGKKRCAVPRMIVGTTVEPFQ